MKRSKMFRASGKASKKVKEEEKMLDRVFRESPFSEYKVRSGVGESRLE